MMSVFHLLYLFSFLFSVPVATGSALKEEGSTPVRIENETSIPWTSERKLNWSDFLSQPEMNTDAVASTSTSLGLTYKADGSDLKYEITCYFTKPKSWGLLKTEYILAHEQAHFDITELYARKLYQSLQEYKFNQKTYKKDIKDLYQQIVEEKEEMQEAYDGQTDHSRNRKVQEQWLEKINQLLVDTEVYAAYP